MLQFDCLVYNDLQNRKFAQKKEEVLEKKRLFFHENIKEHVKWFIELDLNTLLDDDWYYENIFFLL